MALDILLLIGVLTSLFSGVDFLLRPHQKQEVQRFLEDITLEAEEHDPSNWIPRIKEPGVQALLIMVTYFELALLAAILLLLQAPLWKSDGLHGNEIWNEYQIFVAVLILMSIAIFFQAWRWPLPQILSWVFGGSARWSIFLRFSGFMAISTIFIITCQAFLYWLVWGNYFLDPPIVPPDSWQYSATMWSNLIILPFMCVFTIVFHCVALATQPHSWFTRGVFGFFKATIWRIVEYQRGAVAAIVLIATIALAITKILIQ